MPKKAKGSKGHFREGTHDQREGNFLNTLTSMGSALFGFGADDRIVEEARLAQLQRQQENAEFQQKLLEAQQKDAEMARMREQRNHQESLVAEMAHAQYEEQQRQLYDERRGEIQQKMEQDLHLAQDRQASREQARNHMETRFKEETRLAEDKIAKGLETYRKEEGERMKRWEASNIKFDVGMRQKNWQYSEQIAREEASKQQALHEMREEYRRLQKNLDARLAEAIAETERRRVKIMEMYRLLMQEMAYRGWNARVEEQWNVMLNEIRDLATPATAAFDDTDVYFNVVNVSDTAKNRAEFQIRLVFLLNQLKEASEDVERRIADLNSMAAQHPEAAYMSYIVTSTLKIQNALCELLRPIEQFEDTQARATLDEICSLWKTAEDAQRKLKDAACGIPTIAELKRKFKKATMETQSEGPIITEID